MAVPSPLYALFDYLPPTDCQSEHWQPGQRLRVPFGNRELTGVLIATPKTAALPAEQLKPARQLLDPRSLLTKPLLQLLAWVAEYYQHPPGEVYLSAFPTRLRGGERHSEPRERWLRLSREGKGLPDGGLRKAPRQAQLLQLLQTQGAASEAAARAAGISGATVRAMLERGLVEVFEQAVAVAERSYSLRGRPPELNDEQRHAVRAVGDAAGFRCHLLEGITGSGKTEVYLQLTELALQQGQQTLLLLPEIGLTPQTVGRFAARFDTRISVLHSSLSEGARLSAWEAARNGSAQIVIGTRSAVFTPMPKLGLILVDEEHDSAFKQQDGLRYSARDVAVKRAQIEQIPIVLGSATPSLETLNNARLGRYGHVQLLQRAGGAKLPTRQLLDIRRAALRAGLSTGTEEAIARHLAAGQQALLYLNRRGFAPALQCHDCAWLGACRHCDAKLTVHAGSSRLRCHHCGATSTLPKRCPACGSTALLTRGVGTEQLDGYLQQRFPSAAVHRIDSDTVSSQKHLHQVLKEIAAGGPRVILGTQMLSKGHHFPQVTLVAILDADSGLFSADPRAEERMAQLITQVAGRAGREQQPGEVLIQTHHPDHPVLQQLLNGDYHQHALSLLMERKQAGLPPWRRWVMLRAEAPDPATASAFLQAVRETMTANTASDCLLLGPFPAAMARRAGFHRAQLLLSGGNSTSAQRGARLLREAASAVPASRQLRWSLDVDPLELA